jgi:hypothetical protein
LTRGDCSGALAALRKGSFRSPALQDVALCFNTFLMRLGVRPPSLLHAPGLVMKAEGIDGLSRDISGGVAPTFGFGTRLQSEPPFITP